MKWDTGQIQEWKIREVNNFTRDSFFGAENSSVWHRNASGTPASEKRKRRHLPHGKTTFLNKLFRLVFSNFVFKFNVMKCNSILILKKIALMNKAKLCGADFFGFWPVVFMFDTPGVGKLPDVSTTE